MYFASSRRLTLAGARRMMSTAMGIAEKENIPITVAIADAGGHLMALERSDGGRFHTVHSSTTKAVCAASNKRPTTAKGAQATFEALALGAVDFIAKPGGTISLSVGMPTVPNLFS